MGRFSSSYPPRNTEEDSPDCDSQASLEVFKFLTAGITGVHSDCYSRAIDLVPINVINLIAKQRDIFSDQHQAGAFVPSDIAIGLLFPDVYEEVNPELFAYCRGQFSNGFKMAIGHIRKRILYPFIVVSYNGRINAEFTDEVQKHISLPQHARLRDYEFRLRYGEELLIWANTYAEIIESRGLKFSDHGNLVLMCREKKIIYHEGAD